MYILLNNIYLYIEKEGGGSSKKNRVIGSNWMMEVFVKIRPDWFAKFVNQTNLSCQVDRELFLRHFFLVK